MAKQDNRKYIPDLLPSGTTIEVVKIDKEGNVVGIKEMQYGEWKKMVKQPSYTYRAYQSKFSQFKTK